MFVRSSSSTISRPRAILLSVIGGLIPLLLTAQDGPIAQDTTGTSVLPKGAADGVFVNNQILLGAQNSLVQIYWRAQGETERTSGFAVSGGMFVTVRPDAKLLEEVILRCGDDDFEGRVVLVDARSGIVLLEGNQSIADEIPPLELGASRSHYVGDAVYALSVNEKGIANRCSVGMMIGRDRRVDGDKLPVGYLRIEAPDTNAEGGLPVLESTGKVIGIDLGISLEDEGGEFHALPVEVVAKLVSDLENFGKREDAWIGVTFNTGTTTPKVVSVRPNSPGDRAGIQPGDIVIHFAGARIDTLDDLADTCYCLTPGRETDIHVLRGITSVKRKLEPVSLSSKPGDADDVAPKP